jgi:hypothetical protein
LKKKEICLVRFLRGNKNDENVLLLLDKPISSLKEKDA